MKFRFGCPSITQTSRIALLALCTVLIFSAPVQAEISEGTRVVKLELFASGFADEIDTVDQLTAVDMTPLGDGRQLVLTLGGMVRLVDSGGALVPTTYLNTANPNTIGPSAGIGPTSLVAHPDFLNTGTDGFGKFYTRTNESAGTASADFGQGSHHQNVITEWTVSDPTNQSVLAFSGTSREVLRVDQPGMTHNIFDLTFDNDNLLYLSSGDGGGNAFGQDRFTNAQDRTNIYGTVLRIDPLRTSGTGISGAGANGQYGIPTTNPFTGNVEGHLEEIYAYGVRSPYRMNADLDTGEIWLGDVGEGAREEFSLIQNGQNYGWGDREGTLGAHPPGGSIDPVFEYTHSDAEGTNAIGGFVYRGSAIPGLEGQYIFADLGEDNAGLPTNFTKLMYGDPSTSSASAMDDFFRFIIDPSGESLPERIYSIAQDEQGELYLLGGPDRFDFNNGTDSVILKLVASSGPPNGIVGDVNQDGVVFGDGSGLAAADDVTAFIEGWLSEGHESVYEQYTHGDMNLNGITDLFDAFILHDALKEVGSAFPFELLTVPEPSAGVLMGFAIILLFGRRGNPHAKRGLPMTGTTTG